VSNVVDKKIFELRKKYTQERKALQFSFRKFVSANLHIKRSDVFTHNIHSYPGRLFPYIPIFFLSSDKFCPPNGKVLDPFAGSGTVLLEAIVNPYYKRDVYGIEINPIGRLISKVKTTPISPAKLKKKIDSLFKRFDAAMNDNNFRISVPDFKNIDLWFSKKAKTDLGKLRACVEQLKDDDCKDFLWVCFSKLVREVSKADPYIPPPVLLKIEKYKDSYRYKKLKALAKRNKNPDINAIFKNIVDDNFCRINRIWDLNDVREGKISAKIVNEDSRNIKRGKYLFKGIINSKGARKLDESISLIITSPPYLSAQKYVRSTKLELYWLGMTTESELSKLNRKTIGTESVSLKDANLELGIASIDLQLRKIKCLSSERAHIAFEYFKNMQDVFEQCHKALKKNCYMVLVVGNNQVSNLKINTSSLLSELASKVGFKEVLILRDEIKGRGMITKRHGTGGLIKDEYIIILKKQQKRQG